MQINPLLLIATNCVLAAGAGFLTVTDTGYRTFSYLLVIAPKASITLPVPLTAHVLPPLVA